MSTLSRPAVAILLPDSEADPVGLELHAGGFDPIYVRRARELTDLLATRRDIVVAVIDAQADDIDAMPQPRDRAPRPAASPRRSP